jgi:hypothetical protein
MIVKQTAEGLNKLKINHNFLGILSSRYAENLESHIIRPLRVYSAFTIARGKIKTQSK